jgi:pantetheine-phosphate adenylyltransferase
MKQLAVYAGSFDPPTFGHLDCIERASRLFSELVVLLAVHPTRRTLFTSEERLTLLRDVCAGFSNVRVEHFDGLLADYAHVHGVSVLVRGVRGALDFDYEVQLAQANADLSAGRGHRLDTIFLPPNPARAFISASLVREVSSHGGDVSRYAPPVVCEALDRLRSRASG